MDKNTKKWIIASYEADLRRTNPGINDTTVAFYVKQYKKSLRD